MEAPLRWRFHALMVDPGDRDRVAVLCVDRNSCLTGWSDTAEIAGKRANTQP